MSEAELYDLYREIRNAIRMHINAMLEKGRTPMTIILGRTAYLALDRYWQTRMPGAAHVSMFNGYTIVVLPRPFPDMTIAVTGKPIEEALTP